MLVSLNLHTIEPMDKRELCSLLGNVKTVFVAEEHNVRGGVATAVADVIADERLTVRLVRIGFPADRYSVVGAPYYLYKYYGLDSDGIIRVVRSQLKK